MNNLLFCEHEAFHEIMERSDRGVLKQGPVKNIGMFANGASSWYLPTLVGDRRDDRYLFRCE